MSERSTLHWVMGRADHQVALQQCLQQAAADDSILLLGEAVLMVLQPAFEKCQRQRHIHVCAQHWQQLTTAAEPTHVELLTWAQILALIKQHPLQQTWV